jgi:phospholipid/cholesterol/gamma-HCH transport system permease protein
VVLEFAIDDTDGGVAVLRGALDIYHVQDAKRALSASRTLDLSNLTRLDTAGALLLRQLQEKNVVLEHLKPEHRALFSMVEKTKLDAAPPQTKRAGVVTRAIRRVGKNTLQAKKWAGEFTAFFGQVCVTFIKSLRSVRHLRVADIMHHIEQTGIYAMPIIATMAFMIAVVLAYQGIAQLRPLGAENLTVNLVAISVLREMGVLLTAIMVAGRSGSAFAAEIGVMKVREEVDALQVIGIPPFEVLVMPRLIALVITLPLLTFLADMMGLFGGGVMSYFLIDIPFGSYMEHVRAVATWHDFFVGMIKAPVFAFLIAMVGCMHGMKVSGSAESVGRETTTSVVTAIFLVLVFDALFSVLFEKMGI